MPLPKKTADKATLQRLLADGYTIEEMATALEMREAKVRTPLAANRLPTPAAQRTPRRRLPR